MYKKSLTAAMLSLALVTGVGFGQGGSANAMEPSSEIEEVNFVADTIEDEATLSTSPLSEITPFASFTVSTSSLSANTYVKSDSSFYLKKGEKVKIKSVTWSPMGQKIKLGFVPASGGSTYWTTPYTGGSIDGGSFSLGGPTGDYYIAILADSGNKSKLTSVTGNFDF